MAKKWLIRSISDFADIINEFEDVIRHWLDGGDVEIEVRKVNRKRTLPQNASLHLYCEQQAKALTESGYTQRKLWEVLQAGFDLPVTGYMVKQIFRNLGETMFGKKSTADLETKEMQDVYIAIDEGFSRTTGVQTEWPSKESQYYENQNVHRRENA